MRINLDQDDANPGELARFQRASVHHRQLQLLTGAFGAISAASLFSIWLATPDYLGAPWLLLVQNATAALLVLTAASYCALAVSRWRALVHAGTPPTVMPRSTPITDPREWWATRPVVYKAAALRIAQTEAFVAAVLAALALRRVVLAWDWGLPPVAADTALYVTASVAVCGAFVLLVLERYLSSSNSLEWPEARPLALLARATIASVLLSATALLLGDGERLWPMRVLQLAGLLPALLACEMLLRVVAALFGRTSPRTEPRLFTDSVIAEFFRWPPRPLRTIQDELRERLCIDLRQNWAFAFIRRAFLPILASIVFIGWLLSGVAELRIDERAIYERFGKPAEVWGPGLHAGLPWPLARVLRVENGVVHEIATAVATDTAAGAIEATDAEGPAPTSANRLWDVSHVAENAQVISSIANDKQSFQIVNMDVRFIYRIGLSDEAVLAASYHLADVPELIRSTANRVLVHDFASRTLDGLLGEQRQQLTADIGKAVQSELDRMSSGIDILATLIESIHPPSGAAAAYHSVQSSQITAQAIVARERGFAATTINEAQRSASTAHDEAVAAAHEINAEAIAAQVRFKADALSYRNAGATFLRERYFNQLAQGLTNANLSIIDHRIDNAGAPTIDLRPFGSSDWTGK